MKTILTALLLIASSACYAYAGNITLPVTPGSMLTGELAGDYAGETVTGIGDFNGDGRPDFAISARNYTPQNRIGMTYIIFGQDQMPTNQSLGNTTSPALPGVRIYGAYQSSSGMVMAAAGDFDKDGLKDILISAPGSNAVYLIYGTKMPPSQINLADVGVAVRGVKFTGAYISSIYTGDVNGDGLPDILMGTATTGKAYLYYGRLGLNGMVALDETTSTIFDTSILNYPITVCLADTNKDGYKDILIAATANRMAYLLRGKLDKYIGANLLSDAFLSINGSKLSGGFAMSIGSVGDVNGDGFEDFSVRGNYQYTNNNQTVIVFGKTTMPANLNLAVDLNGANGFLVNGLKVAYEQGLSISPAGDYNNDGLGDMIFADPNNNRAPLILGQKVWPAIYAISATDTQFVGAITSVAYMDTASAFSCGKSSAILLGTPLYGFNYGKVYVINKQ